MRVHTRIWIEMDGHDVFGGGRFQLLKAVERTGSLNRAATEMGMSYRQAWGKVKETEQRLAFPLLERKVGGEGGGGSKLTPEGRRLLDAYERFETDIRASAEKLRSRHLGYLYDRKTR